MKKFILLIIFILMITTSYSAERPDDNGFCQQYDWSKVENLVEPYLSDLMMTTLIQQGLSAEYNTSMAADQALGSATYPTNVKSILIKLSILNCK